MRNLIRVVKIDPICSYSSGIETTIHFFLHCANFKVQRQTLFDKIATIDADILTENEDSIINTLLFGKPNSENSFNKAMLNASTEYILIHYSNANISYTLSFFLDFISFFSNNQRCLIHTPGTLFIVCLFVLSVFI